MSTNINLNHHKNSLLLSHRKSIHKEVLNTIDKAHLKNTKSLAVTDLDFMNARY